ncbi:ring canal kelch homolog [Metopolophium dirhodum]|uniref:ring canal kelch homolog n=1 Tax=Metopolophium dirhodum TaxID=44670 RepID=UPI0029900893|nr:ring canal kelch homolog [Metopolophium dirhodum]
MENRQQIPISISCLPATYEYKKSNISGMYEALQSLRNDKVFCDITLVTQNGFKIFAHKVILASASPYFHEKFTNLSEKNKDLVVIGELDSTTLQLLVEFVYSGKIVVTERNVQDLLPAANLLLLNDVNEACCEFLQEQLHPTNCLGIKAFANLHCCSKLLTSSVLYIQQNFSRVVEGDEFLSLSSEEVVMLISSDELAVPSEGKVVECVIRWVKYDLDSRKCNLPQLMEHVRLPLASKNYIDSKVVKEPLLNNCLKCKEYIDEALHFHFLKRNQSDQVITIPEGIQYKPRLGNKVILVVGGYGHTTSAAGSTEWYDPKNNQWYFGPIMITRRDGAGLAVLDDHFVFAMGGHSIGSIVQSVDVLDLFSEPTCWKPTVDMLIKRTEFGVGVINSYLYAVGGYDGTNSLNSAEKFDCGTKEWRMISSMSTARADLGAGVLNNLLYAVGGYDYSSGEVLNSVECYHPSLDKWTPVAEMCVRRYGASVGVLDGVLYVVGGFNGLECQKSVEAYRPSTGVWTTVDDMNFPRQNAGVVALDGLLYVIGGDYADTTYDSVEYYDPNSDTWFMLEAPMNVERHFAGAATIVRPPHFKTC